MIRWPAYVPASRRFHISLAIAAVAFLMGGSTRPAQAAATLTPLSTFGINGWLVPGQAYPYLTTGNNERGLAYGNGHLYLVSRSNGTDIRILDPAIGVDSNTNTDLGSLNTTGITNVSQFAVDMVGVGGDGAIYVGNLTVAAAGTGSGVYNVFRWANEAATPTLAYSGDAGLPGARIGDDLAITGSGSSTRIAAGFSNSPSVTGNNGYSIIDPTAGTATAVAFAGTPAPIAGDFRLGITFTDSSHVIGKRSSTPSPLYQYTSYSGSSGTLVASATLTHPGGATAESQMAYDVINGTPLLAIQSTGDSHVSVYSLVDPANPTFLAEGNATTGTLPANGNATGSVAWGPTVNNGGGTFSATLYAMSSNQGIQAFTFALSPTVTAVAGDYNGNGVVDAADYVLWRNTLGQSVTAGTGADGIADGTITQADYDFWRAHFGNTSGSGSGALTSNSVPEPTTVAICLLGFTALAAVGRRRDTE
jgi:PEP-CTERM motif